MTRFTLNKRSAGILLHVTSLPGPYGIGDLGYEAYRFADFLHEAKQTWWQMLPLNPAGEGHSPYQTFSAFAGNPLLISLEKLIPLGLLDRNDLRKMPSFPKDRVSYEAVIPFKEGCLRKAFQNFEKSGSRGRGIPFLSFAEAHASWLSDYALFSALRKTHGNSCWTGWENSLAQRKPASLRRAQKNLGREIFFHQFCQYLFNRQWSELREYARKKQVGLIGDIPIFMAHNSADVWAHREFFYLNRRGGLLLQTGVPPDYFSKTGQVWGNPLYRWDVLRKKKYSWWVDRLKITGKRFDAARLDHFIGFVRCWGIPAGARNALKGQWIPGPGADFFEKILPTLGSLKLIAEDLGTVTPEVKKLRDRFHLPGMRVLQFAFGDNRQAENYLPHNTIPNTVVYTGTHDNNTTAGWFHDKGRKTGTRSRESIRRERNFALHYLGSDGCEIAWDMIRAALQSAAFTAIIPMQDVLGLGSEARMNCPATRAGNWEWRMKENPSPALAKKLRQMTEICGR